MNPEKVIMKLKEAGIQVSEGKIKQSQLKAAFKALANEEVSNMDELLDELGINEDGLGVLQEYMKKYGDTNIDGLKESLEDFKSDVEDYAMPAVEQMLSWLKNR